jgi:hypothetical protein
VKVLCLVIGHNYNKNFDFEADKNSMNNIMEIKKQSEMQADMNIPQSQKKKL